MTSGGQGQFSLSEIAAVAALIPAAAVVINWIRSRTRAQTLERLATAADRAWSTWRNLPLFHKSRAQVRAAADEALQAYLTEVNKPRVVWTRRDKASMGMYIAATFLLVVVTIWSSAKPTADFLPFESGALLALAWLAVVLAFIGLLVDRAPSWRKWWRARRERGKPTNDPSVDKRKGSTSGA